MLITNAFKVLSRLSGPHSIDYGKKYSKHRLDKLDIKKALTSFRVHVRIGAILAATVSETLI